MQLPKLLRGFNNLRGEGFLRFLVMSVKLVLPATQKPQNHIATTRDGAAAARLAHNQEVPGSSPGPATKMQMK